MDELSLADSQARTWSMVAQLAFFANFSIPFGGLIATALIYALRKDTEPIARENERNALNFEITLSIFNTVLIVGYVIALFSVVVSTDALSPGGMPATHSGPAPGAIAVPLAFLGLFFLVGAACAVVSCIAARAAWLGRRVRYPLAIPFLR